MKDVKSILIFDSEIESPVVTIAIPTYRRGNLLSEAIQSAIHQDGFHKLFDVMVLDNDPTRDDITETIMKQFRDHPRVSYYKNEENIGMAGNWNRLYDLSKGNYVVMLHDDDLLFPYYLKVMFSILEASNNNFELIYPSFHVSNDRTLPAKELPQILKYRVFKREDYIVNQWGAPSGLLIKKDSFGKTGGFDAHYYPAIDQEFIYRSLKYLNGCVARFPIVLYYVGDNESLHIESQTTALKKIKEFNHMIRKDKDNKWRLFAYVSYRPQIYNQLNFFERYLNMEPSTTKMIKKSIGFRDNVILNKLSFFIVNCLKRYLNRIRFYPFSVVEQ